MDRNARDVLERYASRLLALEGGDDQALLASTLLRLPVRSVLQVLAGAWSVVGAEALPERGLVEARQRALDALRHVTSTRLMTLDLDENGLRDLEADRIFGALSQWMERQELWRVMPRFHPEGIDDGWDLVAVFVAASLVELSRRQPRAMIDYWLRICTIREMIDQGEIDPRRKVEGLAPGAAKGEAAPTDGVADLLTHTRAVASEASIQFVRRLAAWTPGTGRQIDRTIRISGVAVPGQRLREPASVQKELYGLMPKLFDRETFAMVATAVRGEDLRQSLLEALPAPLRGYHRALMDAGWSYATRGGGESGLRGSFANSLESLQADLVGDGADVALIPGFRVTSGQKSENGVYSFLPLLSFMGELLDLLSLPRADRERLLVAMMGRFSQIRSYPASNSVTVDEDADDLEVDDDDADANPSDGDVDGDVAECLLSWLDSLSGADALPPLAPVVLGRIWTRFTYAFADVRRTLKPTRTRYLGVLMHRTIVTFLHAVGVECLRAGQAPLKPKFVNNPIQSSENFNFLLLAARGADGDWTSSDPSMRFFHAMLSFPLWGFFLAREDEDIVGRSSRSAGTSEVFAHYVECMSKRNVLVPTFAVELRLPHDKKVARFKGLFFILNSVQLQGQRTQDMSLGGVLVHRELRRLKDILKPEPAAPDEVPDTVVDDDANAAGPEGPSAPTRPTIRLRTSKKP